MRRRAFIALLGGAVAWPLADRGLSQERVKARRIGLLTPSDAAGRSLALLQVLESIGYRDGHNLALEVRSAEGRLERLPALVEELVKAEVELVVAVNSPGTQAAIASGTKIPIVMALVGDPVGTGFVASLSHPGGTVTGASNASGETAGKRLALLKEALPAATRIAVFTHPGDPVSAGQVRQIEALAGSLKVELRIFPVVESRDDLERAVEAAAAWRADAVFRVLAQAGASLSHVQAELLLKHRLPAMVATRFDVKHGGLMCYYADVSEHWSQVANYVDRILKGAKPSDLPVALPTKFTFVLNLKTARALGITLPPSILALADEVIE